ncbi:MAG TPA: hypothetical protein VJV05_09005 [Pyrinomonadaceae bacterium]|nr:hypothetical protein [Pyrinomonadaceae bacterium]
MKFTRYMILALAVTSIFSLSAYTQKKTTGKRTTKASSTKSAAALPPLDVRAARVKVSNQQANISLFLERLGPIAQAIEALDAEAKTKKLKQESLDKNAADKQKVIAAIRNLRDGMVKLESEFKVKPVLKKYLPTIQGISELAGQAETSAIAGKFVAANTPLRTLEQKLNDTLAAMPNAEL